MSDLVIVDAEFRSLASAAASISVEVGAASRSVSDALSQALFSMPGADSRSSISNTGTAVDDRRKTLSNRYEDFGCDLTAAANSFAANEAAAEEALRSAGVLPGHTGSGSSAPGVDSNPNRFASRLGPWQ